MRSRDFEINSPWVLLFLKIRSEAKYLNMIKLFFLLSQHLFNLRLLAKKAQKKKGRDISGEE